MAEKFSYSRLSTYESCPYKYNLKYNLKKFISSDNVASEFGSLVHKAFEMQTNMIISGQPIDYELIKKFFVESDGARGALLGVDVLSKKYKKEWNELDKTGKTYAQKAERFLESGIYRLENYMKANPDLVLYAAELPFEYKFKGYTFHGFIDRVFYHKSDKSHIEIHDIKTSATEYDDKKCTTPLQRVIYVQALKNIMPKDEFGEDLTIDCFYEFPIAESMKAAGTKGFINRGLKKIDSLLEGIKANDYKCNPSPLCYWCEYCNNNPLITPDGKNMCPYYSLWTPDNRTFATFLPWLGMECDDLQRKKLITLSSMEDEDDFEI